MITFIPKDGEGNARAGMRAACKMSFAIFIGLPYALCSMIIASIRNRRSNG